MEAKQKQSGKNRKGKLSLKRKNTSGKEDSNSSTGDQRSEILKAITGETSLDQSEDFRDVGKTVRLQLKKANPKLLKKALSNSSRLKSNTKPNPGNKDSASGVALSGSESKNDKDRGRSLDVNKQSKQVDVDAEDDLSISSCTVRLSKIPLASEAADSDTRTCPVCHKQMSNITGSQEMQDHVNICLKKRFSAVGDTSEDEHLARQLQEREQEKDMEEKQTEDEFYPCQLCHKDLSKMNTRRRLQHMNRCIDVNEKEKKEEERIHRNLAKRLIPDCPMCGIQLNTKLQRESHLKRCARELGVPSAQLIEVVKRQEEEIASRVDVPPQPEKQDSSSTIEAQPNLPRPRGRPKKRKKNPGEDLDEETQLAIAMSASLSAQPGTSETPGESGGDVLVRPKKGRKKKNVEKEVPVLLVRSDAERQRMLEGRLANLVAPQDVQDVDKTPSLRRSKVADKCTKPSRSSKSGGKPTLERQSSLLWELSAQDDPELVSRTPFYVSQLKPNIAPEHKKTPGKKGRKRTPAKQVKPRDIDEVSATQGISSTLQVLMDLEEEGTHVSSPSIESGESTEQASGYLGDPKATSQVSRPGDEHEKLVLQQLSSLINNEELSDFKIQTEDGSIVHAHKLLLHLRCPTLLQHLNENSNKGKCTLDIPKMVLLSILKYVYCGSIEVDGSIALSVLQNAQKYHLPDLARSCQPILKTRTTPHKSSNKAAENGGTADHGNSTTQASDDDEYKEKDLNELLQSIWDDSEDDSKSSSKDSDSEKEGMDDCPNEAEMQEIYEYASTQAKQSKQTGSQRSEVDKSPVPSADNSPIPSADNSPIPSADNSPIPSDSTRVEGNARDIASTDKSTEPIEDNINEDQDERCMFDIQLTHSNMSPSHQSPQSNKSSHKKIVPSITGRLTRRGWKPFSTKETPSKLKKTTNASDPSSEKAVSSSASFTITDDYNEQDVEMEDVSKDDDPETDLERDGNESIEPITATSVEDASTSLSKTLRESAEDEDISPPTSPVRRSSPKKTQSSQKEQTSPHKSKQSSGKIASRTHHASESDVVDDTTDVESNQLDESIDESDTSWIIPNTPPVKSAPTLFAPPKNRAPQSRLSQGSRHKQNTSKLTASTPVDVRNKMGSFGSIYLPKMSPVKIVLEKLPLDTASPAATSSRHTETKNCDTDKQTTDAGSGIEQSSLNDSDSTVTPSKHSKLSDKRSNIQQEKKAPTRQSRRSVSERSSDSSLSTASPVVTSSRHVQTKDCDTDKTTDAESGTEQSSLEDSDSTVTPSKPSKLSDKRSNTQQEQKAQTRQSRRTISERSSDSSPGHRSTRSSSQSPVQQIQRKKLTLKGSSRRNLKGSPKVNSSKTRQGKNASPSSQNSVVGGTSNRRNRKVRVADSGKGTPDSSKGRASPIDIPDPIDVPTPVKVPAPIVLSDESSSPTPSPKFGGISSTSLKGHVGKPSKRKRKQSMPMRSPDRLLMTSNDAAVNLTQNGKLTVDVSKPKQRTKVLYSSPKIRRRTPPYFPLKKKYKSFSTIHSASHVRMRRRTRSMSKGTPVAVGYNGNRSKSGNGDKTVDKTCHNSSEISSPEKPTPTKKQLNSSRGMEHHRPKVTDNNQEKSQNHDIANGVTSKQPCSHIDTDDNQVHLVGNTPSGSEEDQTETGTNQIEEEVHFAFDVDDGGFDDFHHNFSTSNLGSPPNAGEQQNNSKIYTPESRSVPQVRTPKVSVQQSSPQIAPPSISSPPESPIDSGQQNNTEINTRRVQSRPGTTPQNSSKIDSARVRSPPEVRIPKVSQKDNYGKELWANLYITPVRSSSNFTSPVITEKVLTMENYTPLTRQPRSQQNGDVVSFVSPEIVPPHRQATASPTLREHHFSPTQVVSPVESATGDAGYFGIGSDSFMMEMQEGVIETSVMSEEVVIANDEDEEDVAFVPPPCAIQNANHNVAVVRPTPVRPNVEVEYLPPGPITPMPNYDDMNTPALRKETYKYGLKPLRKKQARLKLKEIYQYTHQVLETSLVEEDDSNDGQSGHAASKATAAKKKTKRVAKPRAKQSKSAKGQGSNSLAPATGDKPGSDGASKDNGTSTKDSTQSAKQKEAGQGESSGDTSDAPSNTDCPEDSILDDDEDEIPMSQPLSKNPEEAIFAYIKGNKKLHQKILMYEPVFIKDFQKELKEAGIICSMNQLKPILDKQCITFRAEANVNRHVRKGNKKKKTK